LLKICNIQHRPIVMLDENVQYKVENLYLVSSPTILLPNYKKGVPIPTVGCFYCPSALRYLREMMVSRGACGFNYPNRIFLSRKNVTSGRRSFNEEECTACAKRFGFKVVYPEMMTFEQQIGLFHNAKYIIGGSGAAFTNLVYCSQGVKVVVLCKFHSNLGIWQPIVEYVGGKMCCLEENEGQTQPPQVIHDSFRIDIDKLEGVLANIIGE